MAPLREKIKPLFDLARPHSALFGGFLKLSVLRVVQMGLGLVTTYFLAHALSVEKYGEYQFVLNVVGVLTIFTLTEFSNTLMQSVARGYYGSYGKMIPFAFFTSIIGSVILLGFSWFHGFAIEKPEMGVCFVIGAILFPFSYGLTLWRGLKIGEERFSDYIKLETTGLVITQAGMIASAILFEGRYVEVFLCFALVPAIVNGVIVYKTWRKCRETHADVEDRVIAHGVSASFFSSFSTLANYVDKILLSFFLSPAALAIFVAADRIPDLLRSTIQDAATTLAPRFARTDVYSDKLDRFFKIFCAIYGAGLVFAGFFILPYILTAIYGRAYEDSIPYMQALMVSVALGNLGSLQFRYIRSKLDTRNFRNISVGSSVFRIVMSFTFIPLYGIAGAVLSAMLFRIGLSLLTDHIVRRDYRTKPS